MSVLGIILFFIGLIGAGGFFYSRYKAGRIGATPLVPTADAASKGASVAGEKGAIAVQGKVVCETPLLSPVTQTPCLAYKLEVNASWKVGDNKDGVEVRKDKEAAKIAIDDGSGPVEVVLSNMSDDEEKQSFKKSASRGLMAVLDGNKLKFGDKGFYLIAGQDVPGKKIPDDAEYTVVETILPVLTNAYVAGKADAGKIVAPSWVSLLISAKTKDELLAATATNMQRAKYVAIGGVALGAVFSIVGALTGGGEPAKPTAEKPAIEATVGAGAAAPVEAAPPAEAPAAPAPQ